MLSASSILAFKAFFFSHVDTIDFRSFVYESFQVFLLIFRPYNYLRFYDILWFHDFLRWGPYPKIVGQASLKSFLGVFGDSLMIPVFNPWMWILIALFPTGWVKVFYTRTHFIHQNKISFFQFFFLSFYSLQFTFNFGISFLGFIKKWSKCILIHFITALKDYTFQKWIKMMDQNKSFPCRFASIFTFVMSWIMFIIRFLISSRFGFGSG